MVRVEGCLGFKIADSPVTYLVVDSLEKVQFARPNPPFREWFFVLEFQWEMDHGG